MELQWLSIIRSCPVLLYCVHSEFNQFPKWCSSSNEHPLLVLLLLLLLFLHPLHLTLRNHLQTSTYSGQSTVQCGNGTNRIASHPFLSHFCLLSLPLKRFFHPPMKRACYILTCSRSDDSNIHIKWIQFTLFPKWVLPHPPPALPFPVDEYPPRLSIISGRMDLQFALIRIASIRNQYLG